MKEICPDMELPTFQIIAGSISSLLFISGNIPMLVKAFRTKNLRSYSLSNIILINVGNLVYWLYISNLPLGPIWLLHTFYTLAEVLMLVWYLRYEFSRITRRVRTASLEPSPTQK
jgi:uncharacterized protein with PQ loop repeat